MARFCRCGSIVERGTCQRCHVEKQKNNSASRGYDYQWQRVRERVLDDHPLCVDCEQSGKVTPAAQVHHVKTITEAPHLRLSRSNLVSLCVACHAGRHIGEAPPGGQ